METTTATTESNSVKPKSISSPVLWIGLSLSIIGIASSIVFGVINTKKSTTLESKVISLENQVSQINKDKAAMQTKLDDAYTWSAYQAFMHDGEQAIVTDDLVVNKMTLKYQTGSLLGIIDVSNQPQITLKYKGEGKYDLSDRELKAMLLSLMESVGTAYKENLQGYNVPSWDTANIKLTVMNYELGTYSGGKVKLKGE